MSHLNMIQLSCVMHMRFLPFSRRLFDGETRCHDVGVVLLRLVLKGARGLHCHDNQTTSLQHISQLNSLLPIAHVHTHHQECIATPNGGPGSADSSHHGNSTSRMWYAGSQKAIANRICAALRSDNANCQYSTLVTPLSHLAQVMCDLGELSWTTDTEVMFRSNVHSPCP